MNSRNRKEAMGYPLPPPYFVRLVNPIPISGEGADIPHQNHYYLPPTPLDFQTFLRPWFILPMIILTWGSLEADGVDLGKLSETEAAALATAAERSVHVFTEQY